MTRTKRTVGPGATENSRRSKHRGPADHPTKKRHASEHKGDKPSSGREREKASSTKKKKKHKGLREPSGKRRSSSAPPEVAKAKDEGRRRVSRHSARAKQERIFRRKFARELRASHLKPALCKATFYRRVMRCILNQQTNVCIVQGLAMKGILVACQQILQDVFDHGKRIMEVQGRQTLMDKHWQHAVYERRLVQSSRRIV